MRGRRKQSGGVDCQFRQRRRKTKVTEVNEPKENSTRRRQRWEKTELGYACSGSVSFVCLKDAFGHPTGCLFWRRSILNVAAMYLLINAFSFVACCSLFLVLLVWVLAPIGIFKGVCHRGTDWDKRTDIGSPGAF